MYLDFSLTSTKKQHAFLRLIVNMGEDNFISMLPVYVCTSPYIESQMHGLVRSSKAGQGGGFVV